MEETGFCVGRVEGSVVASRWSAAVVSGHVRRNIRGLQGKRRFRMSDLGSFESKRNKGTEIERGPSFRSVRERNSGRILTVKHRGGHAACVLRWIRPRLPHRPPQHLHLQADRFS